MAKTDWTINDTVLPQDMNDIGQEINAKVQIVMSASEPAPAPNLYWYEDLGETPDVGGGGGLLIGNASIQDDKEVWFDEF
ncbi:hypothetical protein [Paenibacillus chungangensis]|uniref:Minor tail protein n=1 Tax=Paenibacillus chungangensis TaxID=696535 RepID=A0ABW3HQG1_9BACL